MAKNEKELFEVENQKEENQVEENKEMEMELELDGETVESEMEELVAEKVKQEEKNNKAQKHKRGPKPNSEKKDKDNKEKAPKKEKALDLKNKNIIQREIKKGRLSAPCGRIEKIETSDGSNQYKLLLAEGVIFAEDAKENYKELETVNKMNDGKFIVTQSASDRLGTEKFNAKHENGEEVEHDWVRVELHKPGRKKDVIELFTVADAKTYVRKLEAAEKKKAEELKKKEEKAAKEKAEKEKEEQPKEEAK
jgi:hypothetical protein